ITAPNEIILVRSFRYKQGVNSESEEAFCLTHYREDTYRMSDTESDIPSLIDRCVKRLFRDQPHAVLRLAGVETATVRFEDSNLNLPELRADHVFIVEEEGDPTPYALYLEYQLRPDTSLLPLWALKWSGLCRQLPMEVVLLVIYLEKG